MDNLNDGYDSAEKQIREAMEYLSLQVNTILLDDEDISDLIFEECDNITYICEPKYSLSITVACWAILISFTIFLTYVFLHFH